MRRFLSRGLRTATAMTPQLRGFRTDSPYEGGQDFIGGEQIKQQTIKENVELAAAGHYAQHKPRAIMFINRQPVEIIPNEENLLEVIEREGIRVPKFCYHPVLSVAGNCRMCMVQVEGTQNLIVACATACLPGMSIVTDTRLLRDAREGNVELLLVNHPNDCPICEQATNCDLQNISMHYGTEITRYRDEKHSVNDFYFDPYTRVVLNRCIHCTRCVRFLNEHAQDYNLGMIGRGGLSEISTYVSEQEVTSDMAAGAVQLCPVGKLNTNPQEVSQMESDEWDAELKHQEEAFM
eukprot:PhF_6_TR43621/c0_g1_i1/m.67013/K03934/NDUFS1; NADH dehydrogenase (ubiquinone) Fe-S protein 1